MPKLKEDQKIPRGESDFHYSKNIICCKWYDNNAVLLLGTNVDGMSGVCNIIRWTKSSATKTPASCPNNDMGGTDKMDQKQLLNKIDCKSKNYFYLNVFLIS